MESVGLDMDDLFDNGIGEGDEEDLGALPATLPALDDDDEPMVTEENQDNDGQSEGEEGVIANLQRLSKGAAKKKVMKPQPKLDAERLKGERGLAVLPNLFENVKFKGKGHEASDLKVLMTKLEHWGHRLFPKMPFDEFTEKLEKLGSKKPVQTLMKRIRLDMPLLDTDYVQQYDEEGDADANAGETAAADTEVDEMNAEEAYDAMLRQERELMDHSQESSGGTAEANVSQPAASVAINTPSKSSSQSSQRAPGTPVNTQASQKPQTPGTVSDDQKTRMERNKLLAMQKRAARMGVPVSSLMSPSAGNPSQSTTDKTPETSSSTASAEKTSNENSKSDQRENSSNVSDRLSLQTSDKNASNTEADKDSDKNESTNKNIEDATAMQTEDELLAGLDDSDFEEDLLKQNHTPMEFSAPPVNTEAMLNSDKLASETTTDGRLNSVDSEMDSVNLHLSLDSDDDETDSGAAATVDKENVKNTENVNNNTEDSAMCESEVIKLVDSRGNVDNV